MKNLNISIIFIIFVLGLIPYAPFITNAYGISVLSRELIIFLLSICIFINIPYSDIQSKCIMIGFSIIQFNNFIFQSLYFFFYIKYSDLLLFSSHLIILTVSFLLSNLLFKRYSYHSEIIDDNFIYYLCPRPDDFNGLISSLFYLPFGGVKVYCKGNVYAYRKGKLEKFTGRRSIFYIQKCFCFNTNVIYSNEIEKELDSLVGKTWSINNNCYSTFEPMFGKLKSIFRG